MRTALIAAALCASLALPGCKSALINVTVSNHRATAISLVEVDYPSATFGIQQLDPGQDYHYRLKVIGNGPATVLWNEGKDQKKSSGPVLRDGDAGILNVTFTDSPNPTWDVALSNRSVR